MPRPRKVSASFARIRLERRLLYDWLRENHDTFADELERTPVRGRWKVAMTLFAQHNLVDGTGKAPTQDTAVRTWKQVCADVANGRAKRLGARPPALAADEIAPGVRRVGRPAVPPTITSPPATDMTHTAAHTRDATGRPDIESIGPSKGRLRSTLPASVSAAGSNVTAENKALRDTTDDVDAAVRDIVWEMQKNTPKMP